MSITDSRIRAAVWQGSSTGRWYVDVYYARRRSAGSSPVVRSDRDRDPGTPVIEQDFATRLEALDYAAQLVGTMRLTTALATGTTPAGKAATAWARLGLVGRTTTPEPLEAP